MVKRIQVAVSVPKPVDTQKQGFDYLVEDITAYPIGMIVKIPFGRRVLWGIVVGHSQNETIEMARLRAVIGHADLLPLSPDLLKFLKQVASWTLAPFGAVVKLMLNTPAALEPPATQRVYKMASSSPAYKKLTKKQEKLLTFLADKPPLSKVMIAKEAGVSIAMVQAMARAGWLEPIELAQDKIESSAALSGERLTLNMAQAEIAHNIRQVGLKHFNVHLIDGVTGAGKTELYFDLMAQIVASGQQVLILLPEIALITNWQSRFEKWFARKPAIWHSSISKSKRRKFWRQAIAGEAMVIAGARSALFLPFTKLGLIIVDEEHDGSFKQDEQIAYHARDMAILKAKIENIPILLASATPSLESWVNAGGATHIPAKPDWHYHRLQQRFGAAKLPEVQLIDLRATRPPARRWLSPMLINALGARFKAGEQSLLFLNRRGYAPMTICAECNYKMTCHQCDALLVTHKQAGRIQCHICGHSTAICYNCPACDAVDTLRAVGPGVERLEEEVRALFPQARTAILSSDMMKKTGAIKNFFEQVNAGQIDIIIGTQMAAKGHHFPNLTLVGIVDADLGLSGGDLRASERCYQLLWQVAGRSGRSQKAGEVLVQTYQPNHPVLQAISNGYNDKPLLARNRFMQLEAEARRTANMPPFARLALLNLTGRNLKQLEQNAQKISSIRPQFLKVDIYGPAPAPLHRAKGAFRIRFLIRADRDVDLQKIIIGWLDQIKMPSSIRVTCDIDPYNFL